jgi:hypothetical protein
MPNVSKKIQIISMDSRHQKNIIKLFTNLKKQNPYKIAAIGRGGARAHAFSAKRNSAGLSHRKETEGAAPLLQSWSAGVGPTSTPSLLCSRTRCTTRRWTRSLPGRAGRLRVPSREAVGNGGGDHEAEVIWLVLHRRLRAGGREGSNAIRWLAKTVERCP